jgi:hypothetical protein
MGRLDTDDGGDGGVLGACDHRGGPCHSLPDCSRGSAASATSSGQNRADDALAERFARGEIDENEYRQRLAALREHR